MLKNPLGIQNSICVLLVSFIAICNEELAIIFQEDHFVHWFVKQNGIQISLPVAQLPGSSEAITNVLKPAYTSKQKDKKTMIYRQKLSLNKRIILTNFPLLDNRRGKFSLELIHTNKKNVPFHIHDSEICPHYIHINQQKNWWHCFVLALVSL